MRFMMIMQPGSAPEAGVMPPPEFFGEMMKFNQAMADAGVIVSGEGLHPTVKGARISFEGGKPHVARGPFPSTSETIGGFWMIKAASLDEALGWARRCPTLDGQQIELRQVQEAEDFSQEIRDAVAEPEAALRAQLEKAQG